MERPTKASLSPYKPPSRMDFTQLWKDLYYFSLIEHPLAPPIREALEVIDAALDDHGQDHVSISFNGGKDCTVLLYLFACALAKRSTSNNQPLKPIASIYIPVPSPFHVLEEFIDQCEKDYDLSLYRIGSSQHPALPIESVATPRVSNGVDYIEMHSPSSSPPAQVVSASKGGEGMRRALEVYKSTYPHISAILIGTRSTDPHGGKLSFRNMTDEGWPTYERVNPIINWSYSEVWEFLLHYKVPYCPLYDQGYTSLGSTFNTFPNPALLMSSLPDEPTETFEPSLSVDRSPSRPVTPASALFAAMTPTLNNSTSIKIPLAASPRYRPAYELRDGNLERAGRGKAPERENPDLTKDP